MAIGSTRRLTTQLLMTQLLLLLVVVAGGEGSSSHKIKPHYSTTPPPQVHLPKGIFGHKKGHVGAPSVHAEAKTGLETGVGFAVVAGKTVGKAAKSSSESLGSVALKHTKSGQASGVSETSAGVLSVAAVAPSIASSAAKASVHKAPLHKVSIHSVPVRNAPANKAPVRFVPVYKTIARKTSIFKPVGRKAQVGRVPVYIIPVKNAAGNKAYAAVAVNVAAEVKFVPVKCAEVRKRKCCLLSSLGSHPCSCLRVGKRCFDIRQTGTFLPFTPTPETIYPPCPKCHKKCTNDKRLCCRVWPCH